MVRAKKFLYAKRFIGEIKITDFELVEEDLPAIKEGEYLAEALFHSVDPHQRLYMDGSPLGVTMKGAQVAKITESKAKDFPVGSIIFGYFGWRTHTIINTFEPSKDRYPPYILPPLSDLPLSLGVGVLGIPGITAYFGFLEVCQPKSTDIVVVSGAAGAVGSIVGQIAKIQGCTVIGIAGTDEKCNWLTDTLGFDYAINYKTVNVAETLKSYAPDGIDCYFDNVGGTLSSTIILNNMKVYGRILVCGSTSTYNETRQSLAPVLQMVFILKQLSMHGFHVSRWIDVWLKAIEQLAKWVQDRRIKYKETVYEGFVNMPKALIDMFHGRNTGKAVVKSYKSPTFNFNRSWYEQKNSFTLNDFRRKDSDFELVDEDLPDIKDEEYLAEALFHSVDPYQRIYMEDYPLGVTMIGGQIAKIIESKAKDFPVGSIIFGHFGWRTHTIVNTLEPNKEVFAPYILPPFGELPLSLGLGVLGMPGITAYFGFLEFCQPKLGDIVVVSGAAGAVGSIVGQIAKIKGYTVIGIAGTDEKCKWLTDTLGFDYAFNYKIANVTETLKSYAPDGVDCYFDNVGGTLSSIVLSNMKLYGRISVCGCVSTYNETTLTLAPVVQNLLIKKQLTMQGFVVTRWTDVWLEGIKQLTKWVQDGKIKYNETVTEGFENMPKALADVFRGCNTGKAIVKP